MAWTAPTDKSTGDIITASIFNSLLGATGNIAETAPAKFTTAGDTIYADGANSAARLPIGAANEILAVNTAATAPEWIANAPAASAISGWGNDKILYTGNSGTLTELALGASGEVLTANGATSAPTFAAAAGGGAWECIAASNTSTSFTNTSAASILNFPSISILPGEWFIVTGRVSTTTTNGYACNIWVNPTSSSETARFMNSGGSVGSALMINTWYASAGGFWFIGCVGTTAVQEPSGSPGDGGAGWTAIGFTNSTTQTDYTSWNTGNASMLYNNPSGYPKKNFHYNEEITAIDIYAGITGGYTSALESCYVYKIATSV